jgi:DNA polymerase III delta subunit
LAEDGGLMVWTTERLLEEVHRWKSYGYSKDDCLDTLRNPNRVDENYLELLKRWTQKQLDEVIAIIEAEEW